MANVLVTGATGLLGTSLIPYLRSRQHRVIGVGNSRDCDLNLDLTSPEQIMLNLCNCKPDVIVNLAALTNVDECEANPQLAYLLNVKIVENLRAWVYQFSSPCHFIQISTDQLYDGAGPHTEAEKTIHNYYSMSKLAGELAALTMPSTILRTNFVGRSACASRSSFTDWLHKALLHQNHVNVFSDVLFSPLSISTLCASIDQCITHRPHGIFNLGSRNGMSKAEFAMQFAMAVKLPTDNLKVAKLSQASLLAKRPLDMRMDSSLYESELCLQLPSLLNEIQAVSKDYASFTAS